MAFATGLSVLHSLLHFILLISFAELVGIEIPDRPWWGLLLSFSWFQVTMNLLAYSVIVGIAQATDYYRRFRERELVATKLSAQLAHAQLHALRMQLNPHFLFNAMNTIAMLVRKKANNEAVTMLSGLCDLLRYVLEETKMQEVPLHEELDFLERYLAIEQARFGERLRVQIDREHPVLDAYLPNLILQPLVENAVRHGIAQRSTAGNLHIRARRDDGKLIIQIQDDGPGLASSAETTTGVGIENTRARLQQLYGDAQSFELSSVAETEGTIATISLPFHTRPVGEPPPDP